MTGFTPAWSSVSRVATSCWSSWYVLIALAALGMAVVFRKEVLAAGEGTET